MVQYMSTGLQIPPTPMVWNSWKYGSNQPSHCEVPFTEDRWEVCFGANGAPVRIQKEGFKLQRVRKGKNRKSRPAFYYPYPAIQDVQQVQVQSRRKARGAGPAFRSFSRFNFNFRDNLLSLRLSASLRARASSSPYDALFSLSLTFSASLIRSFSRVSFIRSHSRSLS